MRAYLTVFMFLAIIGEAARATTPAPQIGVTTRSPVGARWAARGTSPTDAYNGADLRIEQVSVITKDKRPFFLLVFMNRGDTDAPGSEVTLKYSIAAGDLPEVFKTVNLTTDINKRQQVRIEQEIDVPNYIRASGVKDSRIKVEVELDNSSVTNLNKFEKKKNYELPYRFEAD